MLVSDQLQFCSTHALVVVVSSSLQFDLERRKNESQKCQFFIFRNKLITYLKLVLKVLCGLSTKTIAGQRPSIIYSKRMY